MLEPRNAPIKLLIVDDSWVLRRVLRGTLSQRADVEIVGEATNGVEALELILKLAPDVILLDVEMPIMDGMTTLQHLMIHTPTAVIMLSSLSKWASARCFDALKYGAVDFVSKNSFFKGIDGTAHSKLVISKVLLAADVSVESIDPMQLSQEFTLPKEHQQVVFCEECGTKNRCEKTSKGSCFVTCKKCGDEIPITADQRYRRMNYLTVIGTGASGYGNLIKIIPGLTPNMGGAIFAMVLDSDKHVDSFVDYLDSISDFQVTRGENGATVEGGCCYIFSKEQKVRLSPYSGAYSLLIEKADEKNEDTVIDTMMESVAENLGNRSLGILLSGESSDGLAGLKAIEAKKGQGVVLNPAYCLHKNMVVEASADFGVDVGLDETVLAKKIRDNHFLNKGNVVTA